MASGTEIFRLFGSIMIDSSEAEKSLGKTDEAAQSTQNKLGKLVSGAAKFAAGAAASIAAAGTAVFKFADNVAGVGDNIDKQSQKLGISAKAYQEWDAILGHCGASIDSLKGGMKTLTKAVADASDDQVAAFQAVGLSMDQVKSMSTEDVFSAVVTGLQGMEEGAERTNIATTLLGKSAQELGPLLNTSAEDTAAMRQAVNELGGVMSDEAVAASASFKDALQDLTTIGTGFKNALGAQVLPYVTEAMTALTDGFREGGVAGMATAAVDLVSNFAGKLVQEIPQLATSATQMLTGLASYLETNADKIVAAGGTLIVNLATALVQNIPKLVVATVKVMAALVSSIVGHIPDAAQAMVQVGAAIKQKIDALAQSALTWGHDIIANFVQGIKDKIAAIGEAAKEAAGAVATFLHHTTPDEGPLAGDDQWMPEMMQQFVDGITQGVPALRDAAEAAADGVARPFSTMSSNIQKLVNDGPIGSVKNLISAVKNKNWTSVGEFVLEGIYNGMSSSQKQWVDKTLTGWLTALNDAYSNNGWAGVFGLGKNIAETIGGGLSQNLAPLAGKVSGWIGNIGQSLQGAIPTLGSMAKLLGQSLSGGITAFFPQLFAAIGGLVGTIGTALSGVISAVVSTLSAIPVVGWALAAVAIAGLAALLVSLGKTAASLNKRGAATTIDTPSTPTPSPADDPTSQPNSNSGGSASEPSKGGVNIIQYVTVNDDNTAADVMRDAIWMAERSALVGV